MRVHLDRPDPGQWGFGIVSWTVTDAETKREVYITFYRITILIEISR